MKTTAWRILGVLILLAILLFIWPTRYRYDHTDPKDIGRLPVRIDRLTGRAQVLANARWESSDANAQELPRSALSRVEESQLQNGGTAQYDSATGAFVLAIYNGSGWTVTELTVEVRPEEGSKSRRIYVLKPVMAVMTASAEVEPNSSGRFTAEIGQEMSPKGIAWGSSDYPPFIWRIVGARGYRR